MTATLARLDPIRSPIREGTRRLTRSWDKTPEKLRVARIAVVLVCLITGGVGMYTAYTRAQVARQIALHTEPLSTDAVQVYQSLADADAAVAAEFLPSSDKEAERVQYESAVKKAATSLAHAGTQANAQGLSTERISGIAAALPVYTGLVERARADNDNVGELREASARMQSTILRETEALQRDEAGRLDGQYRQARSQPVPALALAGLCLAVLAFVQVFLFRKTKRLVNVGLATAVVAIIGAAVWWAASMSESHPALRSSQRHSQSAAAALGQAQIAARQARTAELLTLQSSDSGSDERNFQTKMQLLARQDGDNQGAGGALGAAAAFASDADERAQVKAAVADTGDWRLAHGRLRTEPDTVKAAFDKLDRSLGHAVDLQNQAFDTDIDRAQSALRRPVAVIGVAALLAAALAAWGIGRRLEEYR